MRGVGLPGTISYWSTEEVTMFAIKTNSNTFDQGNAIDLFNFPNFRFKIAFVLSTLRKTEGGRDNGDVIVFITL
jgi:hypothetical protein